VNLLINIAIISQFYSKADIIMTQHTFVS